MRSYAASATTRKRVKFILAPWRGWRLFRCSELAHAPNKAMRHKPMISLERKPATITIGSFDRFGFLVSFS